jgi:hypothetical protein
MAARRANATAEAVARIERERWHADLPPQFTVSLERVGRDRATMSVPLIGPPPLRCEWEPANPGRWSAHGHLARSRATTGEAR